MCFFDLFKLEENSVLLYDAFSKEGIGDSLLPIAEELKRSHPDIKIIASCKKMVDKKDLPFVDEIVLNKTLKMKYYAAKVKYIVSVLGWPFKNWKRKNQIFVQIWHGSPLKKLYLSKDKTNKRYIKYTSKYRFSDIFCSQGEVHNKNLKEAFEFKKDFLYNTGLPRNDILFKDNKKFISDLKKKLNLPEDKKILFYCPTWRRSDMKAVLPLDIEKLKQACSDEYVLLIRSHVGKHAWVDSNDKPIDIFDNEFTFNGGEYPEVTHLYLIADVLISDYSSAIFDFAITGKPQIFYVYDLDEYSKNPGLYFDYKDFAFGDMPANTDELIKSIKNLPLYEQKYREKYKDFQKKFISAEKGNATEQIINLMFELGNKKNENN